MIVKYKDDFILDVTRVSFSSDDRKVAFFVKNFHFEKTFYLYHKLPEYILEKQKIKILKEIKNYLIEAFDYVCCKSDEYSNPNQRFDLQEHFDDAVKRFEREKKPVPMKIRWEGVNFTPIKKVKTYIAEEQVNFQFEYPEKSSDISKPPEFLIENACFIPDTPKKASKAQKERELKMLHDSIQSAWEEAVEVRRGFFNLDETFRRALIEIKDSR